MTVYIDSMNASYRRMKMCHMLADSEVELLDMAKRIGVNLKWIQFKGTYKCHFDICQSKKKIALELGAIEITRREVAKLLKDKRNEIK